MPSFYSISCQIFSPCSRNNPPFLRNATAVSHLSPLPGSDVTDVTDGSVPGELEEGGAGIILNVLNVSLLPLSSAGRFTFPLFYLAYHFSSLCFFLPMFS